MTFVPQLRRALLTLAVGLISETSAAQAPVTPAVPAPAPRWQLTANVNLSTTAGNTNVDAGSGGLSFSFSAKPWTTTGQLQALRSESSNVLVAESYNGSFASQRQLTDLLSAAFLVWGNRNQFQGFDLQLVTGAGLVWAFLDQPAWGFSLTTGAGWERDDFSESLPNQPGVFLGREDESHPVAALQAAHRRQLSAGVSTSQVAYYFANVDDLSDFSFNSTVALQTAISRVLSLQLSYQWSYVGEPPSPAIKKTDSAFTAGLVLTFPSGSPPAATYLDPSGLRWAARPVVAAGGPAPTG